MPDLVSARPLAFVWHDFASAEECDALVSRGEAAKKFNEAEGAQITYGNEGFRRCVMLNGKMYAEVDPEDDGLDSQSKILIDRFNAATSKFLGHSSKPHDDQWQNVVNFTPCADDGDDNENKLLAGLHVDTYNDARPRFATALLYLRCHPSNGSGDTLFASDEEAAARLLAAGIESTLDVDDPADARHEAVRALEASARPLVPARAGTLLLFFVRDKSGAVDPCGYHGSAKPVGLDKWTLQTFWAVPPQEPDVERYASERVEATLRGVT